jgi:hypothetical protein
MYGSAARANKTLPTRRRRPEKSAGRQRSAGFRYSAFVTAPCVGNRSIPSGGRAVNLGSASLLAAFCDWN